MPFATWWRGDAIPVLSPLPNLSIRRSTDAECIAQLSHVPVADIAHRFLTGDILYLAFVDDVPVAYGWTTTHTGHIHEFQLHFALPPENCYLYNFQTLPLWRGKGIYPRLLQFIIQQEPSPRFWIGYEPNNEASGRGITKAGFQSVCDLAFQQERVVGLLLYEENERAHVSSDVFHLPVVASPSFTDQPER
ncbi:GNAT family N-acetyltransferase [Tengunoibacter tsumagoiensis]|uniref:N-acetyltransferase domain-containing protein n=1 Tax=Tengunoibacter tsumagoiensis TaxID=2014871 RepID=A0A402A9W7_9CHLR|nr:GNAT family N-acetyltransferase [Tengunoibacter tsumagoiensis]GCE15974.1 hypothetical protein KTT_58330 [Tengunoibacter tsumagoiensis]